MHRPSRLSFALLLTLLAACGQPVPPEKAAYVGLWQAPQMALLITADGNVRYQRKEGNTTTKVNGPLQGFEADNFKVGVGPLSTTFVVTAAPHADGELMKMTVDGVELSKAP